MSMPTHARGEARVEKYTKRSEMRPRCDSQAGKTTQTVGGSKTKWDFLAPVAQRVGLENAAPRLPRCHEKETELRGPGAMGGRHPLKLDAAARARRHTGVPAGPCPGAAHGSCA